MITHPSTHGALPLERPEAELQTLIDGVSDHAIYLLDPAGCIASWNSGARRIKGYERHEVLGRHFECFYTADDRASGEPSLNLTRAAEVGRVEAEGWRLRKNGSQFWAHVIIDRITSDEGAIVGFAKVTRDVTEQRNAQREIKEANEALLQAKKMEALGQLTGGVAHDFNNLLMSIQASLDLLKARHPDDERTDSLLRLALASVERGASLTRKMLAFSRRQALRSVSVDIAAMIHRMQDLLHATAGPSIELSTQLAQHLPPIYIDPRELKLALINLVANARDALPDGGHVVLAVDASDVSDSKAHGHAGGRYVCISVTDEGQGMDTDVLARATDPFFSTKEVGKGTGLGLSTVHGLAGQSGGWLALHSEVGKGTCAEIWLPAMELPPPGASEAFRRPMALDTKAIRLNILLVDDDLLVLQTVAALLEDLGHNVTSAQCGEQALNLLVDGIACDVLITDYAMPGLTGTAVAEAARVLRPGLAVVLATGYANLEAGRLVGLHRLTKPFDRRDLASALARAVSE